MAFSWQVERENCAAVQYSTPWKNTCLFQSLPAPIICAPSGSGPAQPEEEHGEPFQQQAAEVSPAPPVLTLLLWHFRSLGFEMENRPWFFGFFFFYSTSLVFGFSY